MATLGSIADIQAGLVNNLSNIESLRAAVDYGQQILPPMALVALPNEILYDEASGEQTIKITVTVYLAVASGHGAVLNLQPYLEAWGDSSIRAAVESEPTLGGAADSTHVTRMSGSGAVDVSGPDGTVPYLRATWEVEVLA